MLHGLTMTMVLTLLIGVAAAQSDDAPKQTLITNVNVFDGTGAAVVADQQVLVEGNLIKAVGKDLDARDDAMIIDGGGRTLTPGLIAMHEHLVGAFETRTGVATGVPDERRLRAQRRRRAELYLESGFTTVRDLAGDVFELKRGVDRGSVRGPRIYPCGLGISRTVTRDELPVVMAVEADDANAVRVAAREQLRLGAAQVKIMAGDAATRHAPDALEAAVAEAERAGSYVAVHAYSDDAVNRALDAGIISIEHGMLASEATIRRIAREGAYLCPQAAIALLPPDADPTLEDAEEAERILAMNAGAANMFRWAKQHGVKVLWGTDIFGPETNFIWTMREEWKLRDAYFDAAEQLHQATGAAGALLARTGAANPYPDGPLGVIEPGAYADLLLVDGDPTADIMIMADAHSNIRFIMKDGVVKKNTLAAGKSAGKGPPARGVGHLMMRGGGGCLCHRGWRPMF